MKSLFNFEDETLNKGFQIDMGELSPEQREHFDSIVSARGLIHSNSYHETERPVALVCPRDGNIVWCERQLSNSAFPLIGYPTLCRAAVQLKCGDSTSYLISDPKIKEVTDYAFVVRVSLITVPDGQFGILLIGYFSEGIIDGNELKQEEFEAKLRGIYPVVKDCLTTEKPDFFNHDSSKGNLPSEMPNYVSPLEGFAERAAKQAEKPKYLKHKVGGFIIEVTLLEGDIFDGIIVQCNEHSTLMTKGEKRTDLNVKYFEPCDYTPSLNDLIEKDKQVNQNKPFCGFEFVPEPEEAAHPIPAKGSDDWYKMYPMVKDEPAEVSPETEQLTEKMEDCLDKKLSDNPTFADSIGSHMQLAWDYSKKLVNENTRLRAQLYRLPMLEQENAELKAQLAANNELLSNTEQLPVYDKEWLENVLQGYNPEYRLTATGTQVGLKTGENEEFRTFHYLPPQDSANIILRAVAKELNGDWDGNGTYYTIYKNTNEIDYSVMEFNGGLNYGDTKFRNYSTAQEAIDILTKHFPEVLKNYFA